MVIARTATRSIIALSSYLVCVGLCAVSCSSGPSRSLAAHGDSWSTELNVGERRSIVFSSYPHPSRTSVTNLLYSVRDQGGPVTPPGGAACGYTLQDPNALVFSLLYAESSNLVGVVEQSTPTVVLVMHDFSTGWTWPYFEGGVKWRDYRQQAKDKLHVLQSANAERDYVLGGSTHEVTGASASP